MIFVQPLCTTDPQLVCPSVAQDMAMERFVEDMTEVQGIDVCEASMSNQAENDDTDILSGIFKVAVKLRRDIEATASHDFVGGIDEEHAQMVVPDNLYFLIRLLCNEDVFDVENESQKENALRTKILSICQDIIFLASGGQKLTPKHIGLGVTIHEVKRAHKTSPCSRSFYQL